MDGGAAKLIQWLPRRSLKREGGEDARRGIQDMAVSMQIAHQKKLILIIVLCILQIYSCTHMHKSLKLLH